jgi:hypothetical protein
VRKKRTKRNEPIPYPTLAPSAEEIPDWDTYHIWLAIRYRGRDNLRRSWRNLGVALPPMSPEWDPPIPMPKTSEPRPRVSIKAIQIPEMSFAKYRLPEERLAEYEALALSLRAI